MQLILKTYLLHVLHSSNQVCFSTLLFPMNIDRVVFLVTYAYFPQLLLEIRAKINKCYFPTLISHFPEQIFFKLTFKTHFIPLDFTVFMSLKSIK